MKVKTGVSYILNRNLQQARRDLDEISSCCDFVVHTFSETDYYYHRKRLQEIVAISHRRGLTVYLDPWGVGGVFGGETFSRFIAENPASRLKKSGRYIPVADIADKKFRKFMRKWLSAALTLKPDVIFWDEPHQSGFRYSHTEIRKVVDFLAEMTRIVKRSGGKNAVCVYPQKDKNALPLWKKILSLRTVDIFGTDPYWLLWNKKLDFVEEFSKKVYNLGRAYGKEPQIWIQAFKVPRSREREIGKAVDIAAKAGVRNIAAWSYDCGSLVDGLSSANPKLVWRTLKESYKNIKRSENA